MALSKEASATSLAGKTRRRENTKKWQEKRMASGRARGRRKGRGHPDGRLRQQAVGEAPGRG